MQHYFSSLASEFLAEKQPRNRRMSVLIVAINKKERKSEGCVE